jgi:hypothetical protein
MATDYGQDGTGIESRWGQYFPSLQTGPGAHPAFCTMGTGYFPGVKCGRGVLLTTHPLLVPRSWKSKAIRTSTPLWATTGPLTRLLYLILPLENKLSSIQRKIAWSRITKAVSDLRSLPHDVIQFCRWVSIFRQNILPPSLACTLRNPGNLFTLK